MPGLIGLVYAVALVALFAAGDVSRLVRAAPPWSDAAAVPPGVTVGEGGYDGQFYYRLALDPFTSQRTAHGVTLDLPAYRQQRIVYPLLAWALALGDPGRVPLTLALVNVLALGLVGWLGGALARAAGRHALWGLLFVAYPGFVVTVRGDLTEAVGAALVLGALLLLRRAATTRAAVVLALATLARETTLVVPAAAGLRALVSRPRAASEWLPFTLPAALFVVWQASIVVRWRAVPAAEGVTALDPPFTGVLAAAWLNVQRLDGALLGLWAATLAFTLLAIVVGARALASGRPHERWAWLGYAALATVLEANIWANEAMLRSLTEMAMVAGVMVLGASARLRWTLLGSSAALSLALVAAGGWP